MNFNPFPCSARAAAIDRIVEKFFGSLSREQPHQTL